MNQDNQNEIQIIESLSNDFSQSNRYPRYPLAKESNYKDCLADCKKSNVDISSTTSSVKDATLTTLSIANTILSFFDFGTIGTGLGILISLFGQFWPSNNNSVNKVLTFFFCKLNKNNFSFKSFCRIHFNSIAFT
ncbi:hypothetical protein ILT06_31155 [Bacillus sp. 17RED48]|uniref:hypothetical protein n=1 Tax=Bacillus sp. 17RED48 TaxID=2778093 RepID=UPI001C9A5781|nr:hypothetical protein [Bacillus sp. 17RED48]MBY7115260.1 hypothetical protein [Bacillus sp. 17RED48]